MPTFDIDNYGSLVIRANICNIKGDKLELARTLHKIEDMAHEDSLRSGYSLAKMISIIKDNYPSLVNLL